jgi:hypothetical protein
MFKVRMHDTKTLKWWFSHGNEIDFAPPYQRRGRLWNEHERQFLVDSIINEYDIPKIYLADFNFTNSELNTGRKPYAIIDGRQRLEAIFDFFLNKYVTSDAIRYIKDTSLDIKGLSYKDLKENYPKIAEQFEEFNLHVMSVITDDESLINDLFIRLNTSKSLTGAEVRNAMTGEVSDAIRRISGHSFFAKVSFNTKRAQDKNLIAKLLFIEFKGGFTDIKRVYLDRFVDEGKKAENPEIVRSEKRVEKILKSMDQLFIDRDSLLSSQGTIPVYYWIVRTLGPITGLREKLLSFEKARKENTRIAKTNPDKANQDLLKYDLLSRSVNDQGSLVGRFEIIMRYIK